MPWIKKTKWAETKKGEYMIPEYKAHYVVEMSVFREITSSETTRKWLDVCFGTRGGGDAQLVASHI